jgi:pimeloyl-ACP methyl ester carboxylesterase
MPEPAPTHRLDSTTVRITALRHVFASLDRLSPEWGARLAERLFFTPPPPRRSRGERTLRRARAFSVDVPGMARPIRAWQWGRGPTVALVHGWGGRAAQWSSFVAPLVEAGFSVVAFDAPGHGRTGRGLSSAVDFARALRAVGDHVGGLHAVVAHSLGAAAAVLAMRHGLSCERAVFFGPPANLGDFVVPFQRTFRVPAGMIAAMRTRVERRLDIGWSELDIVPQARALRQPLLVIHDRDDAEIAWRDGAAIAEAWPGARLLTTAGLGHNRPLRDPYAVAEACAFLAEGRPQAPEDDDRCPACGEPSATGLCGTCLEQSLFAPGIRLA